MKILFVCRYNRFRSKFAEAYFKKINENKKIKISSGGVIPGLHKLRPRELKGREFIKKKYGLKIKGKPKGINTTLLKKQDLIIIVADDVHKTLFSKKEYSKEVIQWKIPDEESGNLKNLYKTTEAIVQKINKLRKDLK
ncbi:MAG: hypothetical protein ABIH37_00720 [archaeon]